MKRVISIIIVALLTLPAFTQELSKSEQKKLNKELKKEQQADELAKSVEVVTTMVSYGRFVLEAYSLRNKRGESLQVTSALNFVASDSITGVLQIGDDAGIGPNGVGGVTVQGEISDYKYTMHEKSGNYNVSYILRTPVGTYEVWMTAFPDSRAEATISNATWGGRITF
ncbi:MAG: DUF4251 domain-containing protein [Bacteroidia bacterium]|nr:MAG: DUF4251 domain-containing protein [Bacteroidia bacterium]